MFERRLKIFLAMLFALGGLLLLRAVQLQVVTADEWESRAERVGRRTQLVETTRGSILDYRGREIARDEPCIDACVEFGAISRNPKWIHERAMRLLNSRQPGAYRRADQTTRAEMLLEAEAEIEAGIDRMWKAIARESDQRLEDLQEQRMLIEQRVLLRQRYLQYWRYARAKTEPTGSQSPLARLLMLGTSRTISIDQFDMSDDELGIAYPVTRNISPESYTRLDKDLAYYPGLVLRQGQHRVYPYGSAGCHVLGHLGIVSREDLERAAEQDLEPLRQYLPNDLIGRGGLEGLCEQALRGTRGRVHFVVGRRDEILMETPAERGRNVRTTIDIELQQEIESLFQRVPLRSNRDNDARVFEVAMQGAAVVIDVKSGEVRALVSSPGYDPNTMMEHYAELAQDHLRKPLLNRATLEHFEPGSTIKPVVGIGAIAQRLITPTHGIECTGYLVINGKKQAVGRCWVASMFGRELAGNVAHHPIPHHAPHRGRYGNPDGFLVFSDALERSCNVYFEMLADQMGLQGLSSCFEQFGLGRETGIGLSEARGRLPSDYRGYQRSVSWFSGIGQTHVLATPLQMANVAATIARDGIWMRPRLVVDEAEALPDRNDRVDRIDLELPREALAAAKEGMIRVVHGEAGTGTAAFMSEVKVAGKTGTAQAPVLFARGPDGKILRDESGMAIPLEPASADRETDTHWYRGWGAEGNAVNHAWFIGFAPADDPQVAVAVLLQYGGSGGAHAAPMGKKILFACMERGYLRRTTVAQR